MEGLGMANLQKDTFPHEICAIVPSTKQFGFNKRKLSGVKLGERTPQNYFLTMGPRRPHNLG
jgi:hypothetical protein